MKLLMLSGTLLGALMTAAWVGVPADEPDGPAVASESFLPRNAFAAFQSVGNRKHQPAISETASWKALRETQLHDRVLDLLQMFVSIADPQLGLIARNAVDHLSDNGF